MPLCTSGICDIDGKRKPPSCLCRARNTKAPCSGRFRSLIAAFRKDVTAMAVVISYILFGYFSGSILFARVSAKLFHKPDMLHDSTDGNPGASNAFTHGGFWCGVVTLAGDLCKGFLPVFLFTHRHLPPPDPFLLSLVLAAPVLGHAFPVFYRFGGGKGIAVSFGCLLGLLPFWQPVVILAAYFLFFSLVLKITPHFHRTLVTYLCSALTLCLLLGPVGVTLGFLFITGIVCLRLHISKEKREKMKVVLAWMH